MTDRAWMVGVYGPERDEELDEHRRRFWIEDVQHAEQDAREALDVLAFALLEDTRAALLTGQEGAAAARDAAAARVDYATAALLHAARRMGLCRAREKDPGPTYRGTKEGLKHYAKATAATRRKGA